MNFLLDTNVVSEWKKPSPDTGVIAWLSEVDEDRIFLSVVTLAELQHGIERLPHGRRQIQLDQWLKDLPARFDSRIFPIDPTVADAWGSWSRRAPPPGDRSAPWTPSWPRRPRSTT